MQRAGRESLGPGKASVAAGEEVVVDETAHDPDAERTDSPSGPTPDGD